LSTSDGGIYVLVGCYCSVDWYGCCGYVIMIVASPGNSLGVSGIAIQVQHGSNSLSSRKGFGVSCGDGEVIGGMPYPSLH